MNLLEMDDEQLVSKVTQDFEKAENAVQVHKEKWKNNYRLYRSKVKEKRKGKANLFIPYIWPIVEQLKARTLQTLFAKRPYVAYVGEEQSDVPGAKLMERLVDFQMDEKINLPFKFITALNSIFCYGTAIALYEWKYEEKKVKAKNPIIEMGVTVGEEVVDDLITTYDDPNVEFIPIDDFFPDPEGWDVKTSAYVCTRVFKDKSYLKAKEKEGIYELPDNIEDGSEFISNFRDEINNIPSIDQGERNKKHEIISYYTDDEVIVVLNRKHVIRKEENPNYSREKPFKRVVAIPLEKEFWGMSIVEVLADLQEELNTTRNQRIDNISLILNKVFLKRRNADIDEFELSAGNIIEVDDVNDDLKALDFSDVTQSAYREEDVIKQDMQYISGVSEFSRGATPQRKETATTVTAIQDAANILFNYTISVIERTGLLSLGDAVKKLNQQYIQEEKVIRLLNIQSGEWEYGQVDPESVQGSYDVKSVTPRLEAEGNKEIKRNQLLEMMNLFTNNPIASQYINVPELMKKILEQYDIKDHANLIIQPQPQQPMLPGQDGMNQMDIAEEIGEDNGL
jgi:hypothetical protein